MKYSTSLLLASAGWASAIIQQCSGNAVNEGGNWFCGKINHILYEGFVGKGSFKAVTDMGSNGECKMEDKSYNGPLAPLDADLSIHVRGPIQLKEAAVYNLAPKKKHSTEAPVQGRSLGHPQGHEHQKKADMVTATIDGKVVSWQNNWFGPPTTTPAPVVTPHARRLHEHQKKADMITATIDGKVVSWEKTTGMITATIDGKVVSWANNWFGPPTTTPAPTVTPHARRFLDYQQVHEHQKKTDMITATIDGKVVSWENNWFGPPTTSPAPIVTPHARRSIGHQQVHEPQKKADMVTATIDGKVVSWENNWFGPPTTTPAPVVTPHARRLHEHQKKADMITATIDGKVVSWEKKTMVTATIDGKVVSWENNWFGPSTKAPAPTVTPPPAPPHPTPPAAGGPQARSKLPPTSTSPSDWNRVAYYSSEKQVVENMVFMGNYGGQGSGVFDYTWGNSLAYLNADGNGGASSPQILKDINIPSNQEFSIFSAEKCDASCGFSRAKDIAYKGFGGATKVFLFHFKMPLDGDRGNNGDMPALWALNARIPRTGQYNACSCWTTGCGEIDIYEVLAKGDTKCKSAFHLASGACSSDFFERPVDKFIKVAVVFNEATASVSIQRLPDNTDFSKGLNNTTVQDWIKGPKDGKLSSLFQLT